MKTDKISYHESRAEEELDLAQKAVTSGAVRAHVALADLHLEIVYDLSADVGKATSAT